VLRAKPVFLSVAINVDLIGGDCPYINMPMVIGGGIYEWHLRSRDCCGQEYTASSNAIICVLSHALYCKEIPPA